MLEDMRDAGGIPRRRSESDAEDFVLVVIDQRQELGPGPFVAVETGERIDLVETAFLKEIKGLCRHGHAPLRGFDDPRGRRSRGKRYKPRRRRSIRRGALWLQFGNPV